MESLREAAGANSLETALSQLKINRSIPLLPAVLKCCMDMEINSLRSAREGICAGRLVCTIALNAIDAIEKGKLLEFDALASECQCHLRADRIAGIAKDAMDENSELSKELKEVKSTLKKFKVAFGKRAQEISQLMQTTRTKNAIMPLKALLINENKQALELSVSPDLFFLTNAYMLTCTKQKKNSNIMCTDCNKMVLHELTEETNSGKLTAIQKNVPSDMLDKITAAAKESITLEGCDHIRNTAAQSSSAIVQQMLSAGNQKQEEVKGRQFSYTRTMLPTYYTVRAVYEAAIAQDTPVIIKSKAAQHKAEVSKDAYDTAYILHKGTVKPLKEVSVEVKKLPAIVIEGRRTGLSISQESTAAYQRRFLQTPFLDILEMNGAHHPQYAGGEMLDAVKLLQSQSEELQRLKKLQARAELEGCCEKNETLFRIIHIFSDTAANQIVKGNLT